MSKANSPVTGKPYGLAAVCRAWRIARSGVYRHRTPPPPPRRRGPMGALSDAALTAAIHGRTRRQPVPWRGPSQGLGAVAARRHTDLVAPGASPDARARPAGAWPGRLTARPTQPRRHDHSGNHRHHVGHRPDRHPHRRRPGGGIHCSGSLFRRVRRHSRRCASHTLPGSGADPSGRAPILWRLRNVAHGLAVRHDHGSQYMSDHFQSEIAFLGIESSPAFVRAPEGNGCAERFIRTLKENLLWVRHFQTIEELRLALLEFREVYNATWLIERHGFMSPAEFRQRQLQPAALAA